MIVRLYYKVVDSDTNIIIIMTTLKVQFASRGAGKPGNPPVSAPLADPNAVPNSNIQSAVDASLR